MLAYILRRLLYVIPIAIGVSIVVFALVHMAPGDPISAVVGDADQETLEQMRKAYGYDKPLPVQYLNWIGRALTGDLGKSLKTGQPVTNMVLPAAVNTIVLGIGASFLAFVFGIGAGTIAGYRHGRAADKMVSALAITGVSTPHYWLAILLVVLFSLELGWLPAMGNAQGAPLLSGESFKHMILPMIALCAIPAAIVARTTRACVMEILGQEFVEALRARGLPERRILLHVTKNAFPTVLAVSGLQFAHLMGGSILVEIVFAWPGTGSLMNIAIFARDMPVLQGVILLLTMIFVATNLLVDILQTLFDPRLSRG